MGQEKRKHLIEWLLLIGSYGRDFLDRIIISGVVFRKDFSGAGYNWLRSDSIPLGMDQALNLVADEAFEIKEII
ncbi:hypothetical protein IM717_01435 [Bacillus velezensis]|uniref:hypothetical protein n=1 Tax=Bacillus TaxID=1386 RepID=UPI000518AECE|nr:MULTISPECIES: hypothetical protein [Bacillus]ARM29202.1 hypothetical protein B9C48_15785 [Bacillus vallismortis]ANF38115.1 hypothetical protein BCBMB205_32250 [Bacillus velezensis]ANS39696.1 hypothetical protein A5891_15415 [Bacillus velezensis]ANU31453.1 hypothetical protein A8142_15285 [Bacillus velezensis]APQ51338.1 hypothetical protein BSO20_15620 [Bacillus amyloliquefaciens]